MPHAPAPNRPLTVAAILLSMFMSAMEATVVATVMPTVVADLRGIELYGWVGAIYMLTVTVTIPTWGKLADTWGRRPVMLMGLGIFLLGSAGSGLAPSMEMLIAFRAIQGIGAGALQPVAITIVGDIFSIEERARVQGIFGAVWGVSGMIGPLLGGLMVSVLSWRWVFYVNLPFGVLSAALLVLFYREQREPRPTTGRQLDVTGAIVFSASVIALLLGVGGTAPAMTLPLALGLCALFVWIERRAPSPILPLGLLSNRVIATASILGALMGAVMMGTLMYTPLYVQAVLGGSPTEGGASVAPMLVGWPIASAISGRLLPRLGFRFLVRAGLLLVGAGSILLWAGLGHGFWPLRIAAFVIGTGMGLANTVILIAVQETVEHHERGVATASAIFSRSIGGALVIGALGALVAALLRGKIPEHLLDELLAPKHGQVEAVTLGSYEGAIRGGIEPVFLVVVGLGVVTALAGFLFPAVRLEARGTRRGLSEKVSTTDSSTASSTAADRTASAEAPPAVHGDAL